MTIALGDPGLAARLSREIEGEVLFDAFSRGRYATDASIYQIEPIGVVVPKRVQDIAAAMAIAREAGVPVLPRGAGTSQCGQTVGRALVIDVSRHLNRVLAIDLEAETVTVEPGIVLDRLNKTLRPTGHSFPIDVSPANRATIGGMVGNNSCGARSIRYGIMAQNVVGVDAILADGTEAHFGPGAADPRIAALAGALGRLRDDEAAEIAARFPKLLRRVGGYNLETLGERPANLAKILVGSEGTLAFFTRVTLQIHALPRHRVQAVCHFAKFQDAMSATKDIVALGPSAVELVDRTMLDLARAIPQFRDTVERAVRGEPQALLLVEFSGEDQAALLRRLGALETLLGDLGHPHAVVRAVDGPFQAQLAEMRAAGLNIMMSMKGDGKPVSFIEDCAVPLEDLADYTGRITECFDRHGVEGTWYAHASVGCLHVRPVLNMKSGADVAKMRAIAEEAFALVRAYKGSHSGEHGDGLVRSEFHEAMFGPRITRAFERVKDLFDPEGMMNPGKIVRASRMDDRDLMRYGPAYGEVDPVTPVFDWTAWGGLLPAVEMCNNNGTCRKAEPGVMCPSFRATGDERHVTRGRANVLRLALTGQLGPEALFGAEMRESLDLCIGCKGCRRECPTGVDMAKLKLEVEAQRRTRVGLSLGERAIAYLPRYAPTASKFGSLMNLRDQIPGLAWVSEALLGLDAGRRLPRWSREPYRSRPPVGEGREVILLVDTFSRWFEPETARAARAVLEAAGYRVIEPATSRPLCCGRTYLATGMVEAARVEMRRMIAALAGPASRGIPIVGLEPSCLLTLRDEAPALLPGEMAAIPAQAMLFEEFLAREHEAGTLRLALRPLDEPGAWLHGHCHQKAFGLMPTVTRVLGLIPDLAVHTIPGTCCGMAGAFGHQAGHGEISRRIAGLDLLPALSEAPQDALIVADGTSCRHQIGELTGRTAIHVARVLEQALEERP
jgi:FAD/FMN-containing dehydrogenase/Fe-S oxidoreductase